ncbi:hypothetical protein HDU99_009979 [Rhizoclosmatium hyalinum]|nr:hypothetical protein HDU99_009979 [Rhizoclosmatium hyalinum]
MLEFGSDRSLSLRTLNKILDYAKSRPHSYNPADLPKTAEEGFKQLHSGYKESVVWTEFDTGFTDKTGIRLKFLHRNIIEAILELVDMNYEKMTFSFKLEKLACGERIFGEAWTGDRWRIHTDSLPNSSCKLLAIRLYSDATQISKDGRTSVQPVYVELMNMSIVDRHNPNARVLLGNMPIPNMKRRMSKIERDKPDFVRAKREMFHACYSELLKPVVAYEIIGFDTYVRGIRVQFIPRLFQIAADLPEQETVCLVKGTGSACPCTRCLVRSGYLHYTSFPAVSTFPAAEQAKRAADYALMLHPESGTLVERTEAKMTQILMRGEEDLYSAYKCNYSNAFYGLK